MHMQIWNATKNFAMFEKYTVLLFVNYALDYMNISICQETIHTNTYKYKNLQI